MSYWHRLFLPQIHQNMLLQGQLSILKQFHDSLRRLKSCWVDFGSLRMISQYNRTLTVQVSTNNPYEKFNSIRYFVSSEQLYTNFSFEQNENGSGKIDFINQNNYQDCFFLNVESNFYTCYLVLDPCCMPNRLSRNEH